MSKMRKAVLVFLIVAVTVGVGINKYYRNMEANLQKKAADVTIADVNLSEVADGTYTGSYEVFPLAAEVKVTVVNHVIKAIELVKHSNGKGDPAEVIPGLVVEAQTLEVDTISGATLSSKVILKAIEAALLSAKA